jgi:hypothetical protein
MLSKEAFRPPPQEGWIDFWARIALNIGGADGPAPASPLPRDHVCSRPTFGFLSEDIGSALKGGAKVCQHQLVNEVLRLLVTEFVINFGRKDATPIQRAFQSGLLNRV